MGQYSVHACHPLGALVWHLGFQGLLRHQDRGRQLFRVVNAIATAYRLQASSAAESLSAQTLQDHLFEAAGILVRENPGVLTKVCGWFREKGFANVKC